MLIITIELLYHALMGALFPTLAPEIGYQIDIGFFWFFCLLVFLQQVLFVIWIIKVNLYRRKVLEGKVVKLNDENIGSAESLSFNEDQQISYPHNYFKNWDYKTTSSNKISTNRILSDYYAVTV